MAKLIGFVGRMGAGKTTASQFLVDNYKFERVAFADALKQKCVLVTPDHRIDKARDRALLQAVGTIYRDVDPDYWVKLYTEYVASQLGREQSIVTDDIRYVNELLAVRELGGTVVYLSAYEHDRQARIEQRDGSFTPGIVGHSSEDVGGLKGACDKLIINDGSLDMLAYQVELLYKYVQQKAA